MNQTNMPSGNHAETSDTIEEMVRKFLAEILYVEPGDIIFEKAFLDQGLDSVLAVELAVRLRKALKISLQAADLYEAATPAGLVRRLEA